jgi:DNA-binding beta-propeller fold protein YncE
MKHVWITPAIAIAAIACHDVESMIMEAPDAGATVEQSDAAPEPDLATHPCEGGCIVESLAGTGIAGFRDGPVSGARLDRPISVAVADDGMIYIADQRNHRVRALLPNGSELITIAGTGDAGYADGDADSAKFWNPRGLTIAKDGAVLVADSSNHRIRRIKDGMVTTVAGSGPIGALVGGHADGDAASARFFVPTGLAVDTVGRIWVADQENHAVRIVDDGQVTTIGVPHEEGYFDGSSTSAHFSLPTDLAVGSDGSIYVADWGNHRIRRIAPSGDVTTFAGSGATGIENLGGYVDGPAATAELAGPWGVDVDDQDRVYFTDSRNHRIRVVLQDPDGPVVHTLAGSGDVGFEAGGWQDGDANQARFNLVRGLAVASDGKIYLAGYAGHRIRRIWRP